MSSNFDDKDQPRRRLDPRRQRTRERLIQAVIDELYEVGMSGIRVSAVARRAGAPQSLFYRHFDNLEDALGEVAKQVLGPIVERDREFRVLLWAGSRLDQSVAFYRAAIDRWLDAGPVARLVVTHRSDGSAFAQALKPFFEQVREQLADEIEQTARAIAMDKLSKPQTRGLADVIYGLFMSGLESIIDGRQTDLQLAAELMAIASRGVFTEGLRAFTNVDRREAIERCLSVELRERLRQSRLEVDEVIAVQGIDALVESAGGLSAFLDWMLSDMSLAYIPPLGPRVETRLRFHLLAGDESAIGDLICGPVDARPAKVEGDAALIVRGSVNRIIQGSSLGVRLIDGEQLYLEGPEVLRAYQITGAFYDVTLDGNE